MFMNCEACQWDLCFFKTLSSVSSSLPEIISCSTGVSQGRLRAKKKQTFFFIFKKLFFIHLHNYLVQKYHKRTTTSGGFNRVHSLKYKFKTLHLNVSIYCSFILLLCYIPEAAILLFYFSKFV